MEQKTGKKGGKREGAGRPPKYDNPMKRRHIHFTEDQWQWLTRKGGDASTRVRELVDTARS